MRKSRFSEEQIIGMLREHDAGVKTAEICRKYGISDATFYKYKARFGGMTVSDGRRANSISSVWRLRHQGECQFRSEEHTSELQSLMRISYAVFCLKKKK